jgi:hypothetical protein
MRIAGEGTMHWPKPKPGESATAWTATLGWHLETLDDGSPHDGYVGIVGVIVFAGAVLILHLVQPVSTLVTRRSAITCMAPSDGC